MSILRTNTLQTLDSSFSIDVANIASAADLYNTTDPSKGATLIAYIPGGTGAYTSNVRSKLQERISVKDFGAIGDGAEHPLSERYATLAEAQADYPFAVALTDQIDWCAIKAAVNYVSSLGGGMFYIDEGTYMVNRSVMWASNVHVCVNMGAVVKIVNNAMDGLRIFDASGDLTNIAFFGPGTLDGNQANQGATQRSHGILVVAKDVYIMGLTIKDIHVYNGSLGDCIDLQPNLTNGFQCENVRIVNNKLINAGRNGVSVESGRDVIIANNHMIGCGLAGVDLEPSGYTLGFVSRNVISGNTIRSCNWGVQIVSEQAATELDNNIVIGNNISGSLSGGIQLRGSRRSLVANNHISNVATIGIDIFSDASTSVIEARVEGNYINGGTDGIKVHSFTVVYSEDIHLNNNSITSCTGYGISMQYSRRSTVTDNRIKSVGKDGVLMENVAISGRLIGNSVINAATSGQGFMGLRMALCTGVTFGENTALIDSLNNMDYGASLTSNTDCVWIGGNNLQGRLGRYALSKGSGTGWFGRFSGQVTLAAAAQTNISDARFRTGGRLMMFPANASAANLVQGTKSPYHASAGDSDGASIRIATADGTAAAGTEIFDYIVDCTAQST